MNEDIEENDEELTEEIISDLYKSMDAYGNPYDNNFCITSVNFINENIKDMQVIVDYLQLYNDVTRYRIYLLSKVYLPEISAEILRAIQAITKHYVRAFLLACAYNYVDEFLNSLTKEELSDLKTYTMDFDKKSIIIPDSIIKKLG